MKHLKHKSKSPLKSFLEMMLLFAFVGALSSCSTSSGKDKYVTAARKISSLGQYQGYSYPIYDGIESSSFYLTMRDGVKIAVNLHLQKGLEDGVRIPTILFQTRYVRSVDYRWPFSQFNKKYPEAGETIEVFVPRGYAWIDVDVRGSGASFGTRPYPYAPDEVKDGAEIVDWIISRPWSDGNVGALGWSYTGTTSEFLLVNNHPAVKAVAPRFALFDVYTDVAFPGGIHSYWFTEAWSRLNSLLDRNAWGEMGFMAGLAVRGSMPVDEDRDGSMLAAAVAAHTDNYDVHQQSLSITFRDDIASSGEGTIDTFSPHTYLDKLESSGAAVYSFSGWFDGAYQHSAIKRFTSMTTPQKLTIGPWDHSINIRRWWPDARNPEFDFSLEMVRFFDYHLKGIANGIMKEKPVHYYTMVEEEWKSASTWPPSSEVKRLYFSEGRKLTLERPGEYDASDFYVVDYTAGIELTSRWVSLVNVDGITIEYTGRNEKDRKLMCYTSEPLDEDIEVTGHPLVSLFVTSTANDGNFFVYLEDVGPDGNVSYVTDGQLRALHRKLSYEKAPYTSLVPYRTFKRENAASMIPGEVAELVFDLLPTSYLFKKGHSIRVAISGADKNHFPLMKVDPPPTLEFHRGTAYASAIDLPIVSRQKAPVEKDDF